MIQFTLKKTLYKVYLVSTLWSEAHTETDVDSQILASYVLNKKYINSRPLETEYITMLYSNSWGHDNFEIYWINDPVSGENK